MRYFRLEWPSSQFTSGIKATLEQGLSLLLRLKPGTCLSLWVSQRHMCPCTCMDTHAHNTLHTQTHTHMHAVPRTRTHVRTRVRVRGNLSKSSREWGSGVSTKGAGRARCESACSGPAEKGPLGDFHPRVRQHDTYALTGPVNLCSLGEKPPAGRCKGGIWAQLEPSKQAAREVGGAHRICSAEI